MSQRYFETFCMITKYQRNRGISDRELANSADISTSRLRAIKRGSEVEQWEARDIASALGTSKNRLFVWEGDVYCVRLKKRKQSF